MPSLARLVSEHKNDLTKHLEFSYKITSGYSDKLKAGNKMCLSENSLAILSSPLLSLGPVSGCRTCTLCDCFPPLQSVPSSPSLSFSLLFRIWQLEIDFYPVGASSTCATECAIEWWFQCRLL